MVEQSLVCEEALIWVATNGKSFYRVLSIIEAVTWMLGVVY